MVVYDLENFDETEGGIGTSPEVTGWNIKTRSEDDRKEAAAAWYSMATDRPQVGKDSEEKDIKHETE